jgi:adenine-specific DNA-methyltransferase
MIPAMTPTACRQPAATSGTMSRQYERLRRLLMELFQLDQPDLDFGVYRVMRAKAGEVSRFLDHDLLPQVKDAFRRYRPADSAVDIDALERDVYEHLFRFFRRYYADGDFLAKRVYKPGVYALPYGGEEVTLHWANRDHHYIKTNEYLRDYAFRLRPEDDAEPLRVHFQLVDAAEGEHGNVKAADGRDRAFVLAAEDFVAEQDGELFIRFEYRPATLADWPERAGGGKAKPPAQRDLTGFAVERLLRLAGAPFGAWVAELGRPHVTASGANADHSVLEAHLRRYAARNTFDYFIHKDLGGFLRRELDFYIKNEIMHLDDVEQESAPRVEQYLSKIRVVRGIAGRIIDFLAQLEDFQQRLWLKKKFVVETHYCVTLDRVPEELYPEIAANDGQVDEWVELFGIDQAEGDLATPGYSRPLSPGFLRSQPNLVVDTRHFSGDFTGRLLGEFEDLDGQVQAVLVHGDNFHALRLAERRFAGAIRCFYLDPPYNTGNDEFAYKDDYRHSSWLALMESRLDLSRRLLSEDGTVFASIDDVEVAPLRMLLDQTLDRDALVAMIAYERSGSSGLGQGGKIVRTKEFILAYSLDKSRLGDVVHEREIEFETLKRYNRRLVTPGGRREVHRFVAPATGEEVVIYEHEDFEFATISLARFEERQLAVMAEYAEHFDKVFRTTSVQKENEFQNQVLRYATSGLYSADYLVARGRQKAQRVTNYYWNGQIFVWLRDSAHLDGTTIVKSNKITDHWSHGEIPKADLANEGGVTLSRGKKPEQLLRRLLELGSSRDQWVCDPFLGSGTTVAVALKLGRKALGVDNERYFEETALRRVKRVLGGEQSGISRVTGWNGGGLVRYCTLESYEDALNNLELRRAEAQQSLLDSAEARGPDGLREQYLLRYMLHVETRGSRSLLDVEAFRDPTAYQLRVKRPGSDESRVVNVDLLETFNWLAGITVRHLGVPRAFTAEFVRDGERRLRLHGGLTPDAAGPWWFRTVAGTTPDGRRALVIWRKLTGDPERDNLVLDEWFTAAGYADSGHDLQLVYVNGDNNLEARKAAAATWRLRLIEEEFHRLMFDAEGA